MKTDIPIARLDTTTPPTSSTTINAVVALIYPYSSYTRTAAVLLVDPDMRQRSKKGQVRVQFHGAAAVAFAQARIGSGDTIRLCLEGGRWVEEDTTAVHTPGRSVDKELEFERRVVLSALRDGLPYASLDVDAATSVSKSPPAASSASREQDPDSSVSEEAPFATTTPAIARAQVRMNLGINAFEDEDISSPIVFDDAEYDPFLDDGQRSPRKRTKLGRRSGEWRLVGWDDRGRKSPSKEAVKDASSETLHVLQPPASPTTETAPGEGDAMSVDMPSPISPARGEQAGEEPVEQQELPSRTLSLPDVAPEATYLDLISPVDGDTSFQLPDVEQFQDASVIDFGSVFPVPQLSGEVSEALLDASIHQNEPDQQARHGFKVDNSSLPNFNSLVSDTHSSQPENASNTVTSEPTETLPTQKSSADSNLAAPGVALKQQDIPEPVVDQQNVGAATAASVEPLFGPSVATFAVPAFRPSSPENTVNSDTRDVEQPAFVRRSIVTADDDEASNKHSQIHEQSQLFVDFVQPELPSNDIHAPPEQTSNTHSPVHNLDQGSLPRLSTTFTPPNAPVSSLQIPSELERLPDQPVLRPVPSSDLSLISPFPASSASTYEAFQPASQMTEAEQYYSTPATSQIHDSSQARPDTANGQSKEYSPALSVIEDPGAPPDTTMMPDEWTKSTEFEFEQVSSPIVPLGAETNDRLPKTQPQTLGIVSEDTLAESRSTYAEKQFDETGDRRVLPEDQVTTEEPKHDEDVRLPDEPLVRDEPMQQEQKAFDSAVPVEEHSQGDSHDVNQDLTVAEVHDEVHDVSNDLTSSRRTSRQNIVPDALSTFFQAVPPRRSHRHREPTSRARQETLEKDSISHPTTATAISSLEGREVSSNDVVVSSELTQVPTASLGQIQSTDDVNGNISHQQHSHNGSLVAQGKPLPEALTKSFIDLVNSRSGGFRTPLSYYAALKNTDVYLSASSFESQGPSIDIFAVATSATTPVERAKSGPKHHFTVMDVTDASLANEELRVEFFRPYKSALPTIHIGDVLLLREPVVRNRDEKAFLLTGASSAWHVWHFCTNDNPQDVLQECRGPPVELGPEEQEHARALREWWLSVRSSWHTKSPKAKKKSTPKRAGAQKSEDTKSKDNIHVEADKTETTPKSRRGHRKSKSKG